MLDAQREFTNKSFLYGICLMPPLRYVTSRDQRRKALCKVADRLSEENFPSCVPMIVEVINMKKEVCKEYPDSEAQVNGIIEWLPRMKDYRDILLDEVKIHRSQYGLAI